MTRAFLEQLREDGVVASQSATLQPLKGGVSSDIYLVHDGERDFVVKRALPKLNVDADWYADTARNEAERQYIEYVAKSKPASVPSIIAKGDGYFAMEYLGNDFSNWKVSMLGGHFSDEWARQAGAYLGDVHRSSSKNPQLEKRFDNVDSFFQLRIEPYLIATGAVHPAIESIFIEEAGRLGESKLALVHGDFSPKNILFSEDRMVVLDCEVANYGDPAFDVAFLLSHLFLKMLYHRNYYSEIRSSVTAFLEAYGLYDQGFEVRAGRLLSMLLLARVDGKSPVEYLTDETSNLYVRSFSQSQLIQGSKGIEKILEVWESGIKSLSD